MPIVRRIFTEADFDKHLRVGDELIFDKPDLTQLRIELTWKPTEAPDGELKGEDLDVCAFLLGKDGMIHQREDLVYFGSRLRWKTEKAFSDEEFDPLKGSYSQWPEANKDFKNARKWMEATLPISVDGSVLGSWDDSADSGVDEECGETMHILLDEVDTTKYSSIVFAAVVAKDKIEAGETFDDARDPVVTIYNVETNEVIAEYKLDRDFPGKDAVCFGRMEFDENTFFWNFIPMDDSYKGGMEHLALEVYN